MDIRISNAYSAFKVYNTKNTGKSFKSDTLKSDSQKDAYSISTQAEDYQNIRKTLIGVPDVRADLVNSIREKIENGTYSVSARDVADKILQTMDEQIYGR